MVTQKERIERELRGEPTGFDVLLENKKKGIRAVEALILNNEGMTREEISEKTGLSKRTVSRYLAEIRTRMVKGVVITRIDVLVKEKQARVKKLSRLLKQHPEYDRDKLAAELGISRRTLTKYMRLI